MYECGTYLTFWSICRRLLRGIVTSVFLCIYLGGVHKLCLQDLSFFDHLPPSVYIFFGIKVYKKINFFDHLALSSCKRSMWTAPYPKIVPSAIWRDFQSWLYCSHKRAYSRCLQWCSIFIGLFLPPPPTIFDESYLLLTDCQFFWEFYPKTINACSLSNLNFDMIFSLGGIVATKAHTQGTYKPDVSMERWIALLFTHLLLHYSSK